MDTKRTLGIAVGMMCLNTLTAVLLPQNFNQGVASFSGVPGSLGPLPMNPSGQSSIYLPPFGSQNPIGLSRPLGPSLMNQAGHNSIYSPPFKRQPPIILPPIVRTVRKGYGPSYQGFSGATPQNGVSLPQGASDSVISPSASTLLPNGMTVHSNFNRSPLFPHGNPWYRTPMQQSYQMRPLQHVQQTQPLQLPGNLPSVGFPPGNIYKRGLPF